MSMDEMMTKLSDLQNRLEILENVQNDNIQSFSENKNKPKSVQNQNDPSIIPTKSKEKSCDYLILSDSIIRRIIPSKFSPNGKTLKRFVRGGVETCTKYVTDHCSNIVPKNILINIGTRDLRTKEGVTSEAVQKLYETLTKLWPNINIFILPIIRRKDTSEEHIANANKILVTESRNFKNISILDEFHPTDDMFFDNAHLHNKRATCFSQTPEILP